MKDSPKDDGQPASTDEQAGGCGPDPQPAVANSIEKQSDQPQRDAAAQASKCNTNDRADESRDDEVISFQRRITGPRSHTTGEVQSDTKYSVRGSREQTTNDADAK